MFEILILLSVYYYFGLWIYTTPPLFCDSRRLYSGRVVHFWTKGAPILTKIFLVLQYMKKLRSSPSEHFLVIRVCQKCQKCKNSEKPGFWGNCGYISKTVWSIFMIFWHKTPLTINKRMAKKIVKNFLHFWENIKFAKIENFFANLLFMVKGILCQKIINIDLTILEI